jgi:hypothetical protein
VALTHAVAVRFQLVPDVIDVSFVLVFSGLGGLVATLVAASLDLTPTVSPGWSCSATSSGR